MKKFNVAKEIFFSNVNNHDVKVSLENNENSIYQIITVEVLWDT